MDRLKSFGGLDHFNYPLLSVMSFAAVSFVFGGAPPQMGWALGAMSLTASVMLYSTIWNGSWKKFQELPIVFRLAAIGPIVIGLIQLIPLPDTISSASDASSIRSLIFQYTGIISSWNATSLAPLDTLLAVFIAIFMLILFVAILDLDEVDLKKLIHFILFLVSLGATVGVAQFLIRSPMLKFHDISHDASLIGFFANKNHMAISLVAAWILAFGLVTSGANQQIKSKYSLWVISAMVLPLVVATNSRAGLFLLIMSGFFVAIRSFGKNRILLFFGAFGVAVISLIVAYYIPAMKLIATRFAGAAEDGRWLIFQRSVQLIDHSWPFGAGLGSYAKVFKSYERLEWVGPQFVNNAHNDYLEYLIEGGVFSAAHLIVFAFVLSRLVYHAKKLSKGDEKCGRSDLFLASIGIIFLFCLHSFVDYPLRRPASAVIFVTACAISCRMILELMKNARNEMGPGGA